MSPDALLSYRPTTVDEEERISKQIYDDVLALKEHKTASHHIFMFSEQFLRNDFKCKGYLKRCNVIRDDNDIDLAVTNVFTNVIEYVSKCNHENPLKLYRWIKSLLRSRLLNYLRDLSLRNQRVNYVESCHHVEKGINDLSNIEFYLDVKDQLESAGVGKLALYLENRGKITISGIKSYFGVSNNIAKEICKILKFVVRKGIGMQQEVSNNQSMIYAFDCMPDAGGCNQRSTVKIIAGPDHPRPFGYCVSCGKGWALKDDAGLDNYHPEDTGTTKEMFEKYRFSKINYQPGVNAEPSEEHLRAQNNSVQEAPQPPAPTQPAPPVSEPVQQQVDNVPVNNNSIEESNPMNQAPPPPVPNDNQDRIAPPVPNPPVNNQVPPPPVPEGQAQQGNNIANNAPPPPMPSNPVGDVITPPAPAAPVPDVPSPVTPQVSSVPAAPANNPGEVKMPPPPIKEEKSMLEDAGETVTTGTFLDAPSGDLSPEDLKTIMRDVVRGTEVLVELAAKHVQEKIPEPEGSFKRSDVLPGNPFKDTGAYKNEHVMFNMLTQGQWKTFSEIKDAVGLAESSLKVKLKSLGSLAGYKLHHHKETDNYQITKE